ncbi:agmatine deiminase family protein [Pseudofulvimonas gallinarii]|jgi:agmatine deiminase|uniref:Agmatine/peptidylarginine deiminase n=1 Tax=Pseudofulvimonas gallinarii TaxID=634155 RepID=A0A4S3KYH5_9GAMM|nr:agmatine deiminase family protein [Pseudofulvimonas gallinarii]TCS93325.1 agmatine/peptidylarginine deiminase [Pseudofulvimonas gallinarii]THD13334.1 hypothetical protein B1808_08575 [Pseudofulvimonas gallinarii]
MLRHSITLLVLASLATAGHAAEGVKPRQADPAYLATIVDDEPNPLPRHRAPWERAVEPWEIRGATAPPEGYVRAQAEYEYNQGIFIRWGSFNALHTSMVVPITTAEKPAKVWIVVSGQTQENSARSVLQGGGANLDYVEFIQRPSDSVWIRDYGPRFIENDGELAISDHTYNRNRPNDNLVPSAVASLWDVSLFDTGLRHGGGNFHLFRNRDAFMTSLIFDSVEGNPALTEQDVIDRYADHQGLNLTITDPLPKSYDSTQHIDMWMLPVGDDKVIIGEYAASEGGGVPRAVTEATAADMAARGYTVFRTPGWRASNAHHTYTNSVIVNKTVLVCQFAGYPTQNAQAVSVFEEAMPYHDIVPIDCSDIIGLSGAIHCIVMHVPHPVLFRDTFDGHSY